MRDRLLRLCGWLVCLAYAGLLVAIVAPLLAKGVGELSLTFLTAPVRDGGRAGGIGPILVATAWIVGIAVLVVVPVGLGAAIWLAEFAPQRSRGVRAVRTAVDLLAATPSIVFGLFGSAFFCVGLGLGFSILAGGLTLACMSLPLVVRTGEQALAAVAPETRAGAYALGLRPAAVTLRVLVPAALPGLAAGFVLALGRSLAETAALIFTSGYVARMPTSMLDSGRALSIHVLDMAMNIPGGMSRAAAAAVVLLVLVLASYALFALALHMAVRRRGVV